MGNTNLSALLGNKKLWLFLFVIVFCAFLLFSAYCAVDLYKKFGVKSEINGSADGGAYIISEEEISYKLKAEGESLVLLDTQVIDFEMADEMSGEKRYTLDGITYDALKTYYVKINNCVTQCNVIAQRYLGCDFVFKYQLNENDTVVFNLKVKMSFNTNNFVLRLHFSGQESLPYFREMLKNEGFKLSLISYDTASLVTDSDLTKAESNAYSEYPNDYGVGGSDTTIVTPVTPEEEQTEFVYTFDLRNSYVSFVICELPQNYTLNYNSEDEYGNVSYPVYDDYVDGKFTTITLPANQITEVTLDKTKKYVLCSNNAQLCNDKMERTFYLQTNVHKEHTHDNTTSFGPYETTPQVIIAKYDFVGQRVISSPYCNCKEHKSIRAIENKLVYDNVHFCSEFTGLELMSQANSTVIYIDCEVLK